MMPFIIKHYADKKIDKLVRETSKQLCRFFGVEWKDNQPQIFVVPDRKTVDHLKGYPTPDWLSGWTEGMEVFLLDPKEAFAHLPPEQREQSFQQIVRHELCHAFFFRITGSFRPLWLNEGLAVYLSKQGSPGGKANKFSALFREGPLNAEYYQQAETSVSLLMRRFGKRKMLKLIKSIPQGSGHGFRQEFKSIFGSDPAEKFFSTLQSNTGLKRERAKR